MRLQTHYIIAIQQPVQLLTGQRDHLTTNLAGPLEARPLQTLLPQTKSIAFPVQDLYLVPFAVAEHKQLFGKRIVLQGLFDQDCQPVYALAEIDNVPAQIDSRQFVRGAHLQSRTAAVVSTVVNVAASTEPVNATATPFGN
jgi:hypothetical protein